MNYVSYIFFQYFPAWLQFTYDFSRIRGQWFVFSLSVRSNIRKYTWFAMKFIYLIELQEASSLWKIVYSNTQNNLDVLRSIGFNFNYVILFQTEVKWYILLRFTAVYSPFKIMHEIFILFLKGHKNIWIRWP